MKKAPARVVILGSYPPNYGGISVHIWRLHQNLMSAETPVDVLDMYTGDDAPSVTGVHRLAGNPLGSLFKARRLLDTLKPDILHVHVSAFKRFLLTTPILLTSLGSPKRILTIHGGKFGQNLASFKPWQLRLFRWMLSRFDHIVCVSESQRELLGDFGIEPDRVSVINAYLPPVAHDNDERFANLIEKRREGKRVLLVAAQYLEHYGLLELLDALNTLPPETRNSLCLAHLSYLDADAAYQQQCDNAIGDVDYIHYDNLEPPDVAAWMSLGDLFIRPTWWDGDAVSVREASFFDNRIVATDVTTRPDGALLCAARDPASLAKAIELALTDTNAGDVAFDHFASQRALESVYERVLPNRTA